MNKTITGMLLLIFLSACGHAITLMPRGGGEMGTGFAPSSFGNTDELTINLNNKTYKGKWVYAAGGSYGLFTTYGVNPTWGSAFIGDTKGVGNAFLHATDGSGLRCEFQYSDWTATGLGLCSDDNNKVYDMQIGSDYSGKAKAATYTVYNEPTREPKKAETSTPKTAITSTGTGFILNPNGYLITNYHIVKGKENIKIKTSSVYIEAKLILKDDSNDIAILKLDSVPSGIQGNLHFGDSSKVKAGDKVSTIGYPLSNILGQQPRYSEGIINYLYGVQDDPRLFQISVPIQPGNSGGPLFNEKGEIIGITVSSLDAKNVLEITGAIPQNVNFAVKSTYIKNLLSMLPDLGSAMVRPMDLSIQPKSFIERAKNNIVLIEAK